MAHHAPAGVGAPTLARNWVFEVDISVAPEVAEFVKVRGLTTFAPTKATTLQDASTYDNDGWQTQVPTAKSWQNTGTVQRAEYVVEDPGTGLEYDPGQERLRALSDSDELGHFRWYETGVAAGEAYEGFGYVVWEPQGGDTTALKTVNFTINGNGARTVIEVPTP